MVLMKYFCFYCSVRLGSIVMGVLSMFQGITPLVYFAIYGEEFLNSQIAYIDENINQFNDEDFFMFFYEHIKTNKDMFLLSTLIYLSVHVIACLIMIIGAFKVNRWLLVPYILTELGRLLVLFVCHVVAMMVLKKQFDLGLLICVTIAGGFVLLALFYMWACVVALFQIVSIVQTKKYKEIFGDDGKLVSKQLASARKSGQKNATSPILYPTGNYTTIYTPDKGFELAKDEFGRNKNKDQLFEGNMFMRDFLEVQNRQTIKRGFY